MPLPSYKVRQSTKAKYLRLRVTPQHGLVVVAPRGFDEKKIPPILKRKKIWIAEALKRAGETRRFLEPQSANHLPQSLRLLALGETWPIVYRKSETGTGLRLREVNGDLVLTGRAFERTAVLAKLKHWLRLRVRENLFHLAQGLADRHRLRLNGLLVKSQRTRWASCSPQRNLSLNTKLLFLPPELVRYVLTHELCHILHMNHSKEFWRLVEAYEPNYRSLDRALREAWKTVPQWLL